MVEEISNDSRWRLLVWLGVSLALCTGTMVMLPAVIKPFLLAVTCGGIAFFGDWIGRNIGKRRYSLLRLRPRTTATIVTILTGVFIAGFLQTIIFATSENAQQAFFHFHEFKTNFEDLKAEYQLLQTRWDDLKNNLPRLRQEVEELKHRREVAEKERDVAGQERDRAQGDLQRTQRRLSQTQLRLRQLTEQLQERQAQVEQAQAHLSQTQTDLQRMESRLQATEQELKDTESELLRAKGELQNAEEQIFKSYQEYKKDLGQRQAEIARLESQRDQLRALQDQLRNRLRQLREAAAVSELKLSNFWERSIIYRAGESLIQGVVDGTRPIPAIRQRIEDLLEAASMQAAQRGAAKGQNGRYVTAFRVVSIGGEVFSIAEENLLDGIAQSLAEGRKKVVMRILAARNTVEGEWVNVEFARPQPNRRIFRAGEEITHRAVDGSLPDAEIFTALLEMLQDVRLEARQRNMIPTLPGGKFGEISHTQLFPVLHAIQAARGAVLVRILAAQETWTADQLEIRFVVGEASPGH